MIESFTRKFNEVKHILKQRQYQIDKQLFTKSYKQIISFLKQFQNKKKKQWQELTTYMVKLYFHEFYNIDQYNYNQSTSKSVFEISETFSQSTDLYSKQSAAGKTSVTNSKLTITNNSIKSPSKLSQKSQRIFLEQSVSKSNLNGQVSQQSLRQSELSNKSDQSKSLKSIQTKFRNYVNALSTGNLQSANNQLKKSLKHKFQQEINIFQQRYKCIVDTIKFLNKKYSIQPAFTQIASLTQLQACIQHVSKKQKNRKESVSIPKNLPQITRDQSFSSRTQDTSASMQQLQQQLKKAQQLFNKKSVQQSMQRRKFQQINKNCKKLQQEKKQLNQGIYKVKQSLSKANKLNEVLNEKYNKLQIDLFKLMKEKEEMKNQGNKQGQTSEQEKQNQKEQEPKQDLKCKKCEKYNSFLNEFIKNFKTMQQKIKKLQSQIESKQIIILQKLSTFQNQIQFLKPKLSQQFQQISFLSRKSQDLKNQSIQQALKMVKLQKLQSSIWKIKEKLNNQIKKCTKLYYHLQTSSVLGPCDKNQFEAMVSQRIQTIMKQINSPQEQSTPFTRGLRSKNLEKQINETQFFNSNKIPLPIKQKNYLIKQIQNYTNSIDRFSLKPKTIKSFKLLYQFDINIRANFHQYIDKRPNLLLILKLSTGAIIGGYSNQPLRKGIRSEQGFIFSLKLFQTYHLRQNYCMLYDDYYLNFGNSEIRIRVGQNIVYSNFGISNAHFDSNNTKFTMFLNTTCERELGFDNFEVYQVIYDQN